MTHERKQAGASPRRAVHYGFRPDGSVETSEVAFENQCTNFMTYMLKQLHGKPLTPSEVVDIVDEQPPHIRSMFTASVMEQWKTLTKYHQWPDTTSSTSAEQVIIDRGRGQALWLSDPNLWHRRVIQAERMRGDPPSAVPGENPVETARQAMDELFQHVRAGSGPRVREMAVPEAEEDLPFGG